jgi:hypothetical protein
MQFRRTMIGLAAIAAVMVGSVGASTQTHAANESSVSTEAAADSRGLQSGVAVRPPGSDSHWPPVGTRVPWTVVQPIQDLLDQGAAAGFANLGTIGNVEHLKKHGDHTPWSAGKERGRVYAKDTTVPANFEAWLVAKCKSSYNTLWIDFFNINGRQYNNAGQLVGSSGDHHLHISVRKGYENTRVTLFKDYVAEHGGGQVGEKVTVWKQANVRSCPQTSCAPPVGQVYPNQTYPADCYTVGEKITDAGYTNDKWVKLQLPSGTKGYVSAIYLKGNETGGVTKKCA